MGERVPWMHRVSVAAAIVQPFLLSWIAVVVFALLNYVLTAGSPLLGDTSWQGAARAGGSLWLLAIGAPTLVADGSVGLIPLVLTAAIFAATFRFVRRVQIADLWDFAVAAAAGALSALLIKACSLPATSVLGALVGGAVVGVAAAAFGPRRWRFARRLTRPFREGWRIVWPALLALGVVGLIATIVAFVAGWSRVSSIHDAYLTGAAGAAFFIVLQILYVPAAPIWALAFLSGAGFSVGSGTHFSALGSVSAPLPAIPLLGAIPSPASHMAWLPVILVAIGILWGLLEARRGVRLRDTWLPVASALLMLVLIAAIAGLLASGGIGPGRMATVGIRPPTFAGIILLELALPLLAVLGIYELLDWRAVRAAASPATASDDAAESAESEFDESQPDEAVAAEPERSEILTAVSDGEKAPIAPSEEPTVSLAVDSSHGEDDGTDRTAPSDSAEPADEN